MAMHNTYLLKSFKVTQNGWILWSVNYILTQSLKIIFKKTERESEKKDNKVWASHYCTILK